MQKILILGTRKPILRGPVEKQNAEDGDLFEYNERTFEEVSPKPNVKKYRSVSEAVADGWRLLQPPGKTDSYWQDDGTNVGLWAWWLVRDDFAPRPEIVQATANQFSSLARG